MMPEQKAKEIVRTWYHAHCTKLNELSTNEFCRLETAIAAALAESWPVWPSADEIIHAACKEYYAAFRIEGEAEANCMARIISSRLAFERGAQWLRSRVLGAQKTAEPVPPLPGDDDCEGDESDAH